MGIFYKEDARLAIYHPEISETEPGIKWVIQQIDRLSFRQPTVLGRLLNRQQYAQLTEVLIGKAVVWKKGLISTSYPFRQEYFPNSTRWLLVNRKPGERLTEEEGILVLKGSRREGFPVSSVRNGRYLLGEERRKIDLVR